MQMRDDWTKKTTFHSKAMSLARKKHPFDPLSTRYCTIKAWLYQPLTLAFGG